MCFLLINFFLAPHLPVLQFLCIFFLLMQISARNIALRLTFFIMNKLFRVIESNSRYYIQFSVKTFLGKCGCGKFRIEANNDGERIIF